MPRDRKPNWAKWRHVPEVKVWEGVALSLGIEPNQVRISGHSWMGEGLTFLESKELDERLFVATRNLASQGPLTPTVIAMGDRARSMVRLRQFSEWALSVGWSVPQELADLAPAPSPKEVADVPSTDRPLEGKGRTSALKLILGMAIGGYGYNPKAGRGPIPKQIADDLLLSGITLTDDTVRDWLKIAAEEVEWHPRED